MPVETLVDFGGAGDIERLGRTRVYTKARWADAWTEEPHAWAESVAWAVSPVMPAASVVFDYGYIRRQHEAGGVEYWRKVDKLDWRAGRLVKIVADCELDVAATLAAGVPTFKQRTWTGTIKQVVDEQLGAFVEQLPAMPGPGPAHAVRASGSQRFVCLGFEDLLAGHVVRSCSFDRGGGITGNDSVIGFNAAGRGNRGLVDYDGANVFYYDLDAGAAAVANWSTLSIVKYLLRRQTPKDHLGARQIKFRLAASAETILPDYDWPVVEQSNATTYSLIARLVTRQRLLAWWLEVVDDGAGGEVVEMQVATIVDADVVLTIAPGARIPAAARQLRLSYDRDPATHGTVRDSSLAVCDVVYVTGAADLHVGTFAVADSTLVTAWRPADQVAYQYAAAGSAGYASASIVEKKKRDAAARSDPRLADVFARFKIPATWDQKTGDGEGGPTSDLFAGPAGPVPVYYPTAIIETGLPLFPGVDYSGDRIASGAAVAAEPKTDVDRLPVLSFWKRPIADADGRQRWLRGDDMARQAAIEGVDKVDAQRIAVNTHIPNKSHSVIFSVSGAQHAIAAGAFAGLPTDDTVGDWNYAAACVTLALPSGLRVTGQWPDILPGGQDTYRKLTIDAGDKYERVFVAQQTVLGIDPRGELVKSNGGWLSRPADAQQRLTDLARTAHAWYSQPHKIVTVETGRLRSAEVIALGDLVARVGDPALADNPHELTVNASVSEIRIEWPRAEGGARPAGPTMRIETFAGELDALGLGATAAGKRSKVKFETAEGSTFKFEIGGGDGFVGVPHD